MKRALATISFLLLASATAAVAQRPDTTAALTLQQVVARSTHDGQLAQAARSTLEAARSRNGAFGARLLPQVSLSGTAPSYNKSISPVVQPDGSTLYVPVGEMETAVGLTVSQEVPWLGARVYASSLLNRIQPVGSNRPRYWQSSPMVIGIEQDLFQPRDLRWEGREQDLTLDIAERQFLESREDAALRATGAYFDLYAAEIAVANAVNNAAVNDSLYRISQGRFEVGKIAENDLLQSQLAVLRARAALDAAHLVEDRTRAALRLELNLPDDAPLAIAPPPQPASFVIDTTVAVREALANGSSLKQLDLQDVQAQRRVTTARLQNNITAKLSAGFGYNQTASLFNDVYQSPLQQQRFGLTVQMPLVAWGAGRDEVAAARAEQTRVRTLAGRSRRQVAQQAYFAARGLAQAQTQLTLAAKADTVANKRFDVAKDRYVIGKIAMGDLYIAQTEKDAAVKAYVDAVRGYWMAYYQLRKITLYDFAAGKPIDPAD